MPADASSGRVIALQHRTGVHITFLSAAPLLQKLIDHGQFLSDQFMVVIAPGITRNSPGSCSGSRVGCNLFGGNARRRHACRYRVGFACALKIIQRENDHRFRVRQYLSRIAPPLGVARQVVHFTGIAAIEPGSKLRDVLRRFCPRETAKTKSELARQCDNLGTRVSRSALRLHSIFPTTEVDIRMLHLQHSNVNSEEAEISEMLGSCIG